MVRSLDFSRFVSIRREASVFFLYYLKYKFMTLAKTISVGMSDINNVVPHHII